jgi:hypothetical protein
MSGDPAPAREAWGILSVDPEVEYGYGLFGGKTAAEALPLFAENPMERAAELQFAPAAVFNYYIFCFVELLLSPQGAGESDMASCFLRLVRSRMASNGAELAPVWDRLEPAVTKVAQDQSFYDADASIYGSFAEMALEIAQLRDGLRGGSRGGSTTRD